jgi:hypothetical protein
MINQLKNNVYDKKYAENSFAVYVQFNESGLIWGCKQIFINNKS